MNIAAELAASQPAKNEAKTPSLTGGIQVTLTYQRDHITKVDVQNSRPFALTRLFVGKPTQRVLGMIPALFYICGMGQLIAALRAIESAAGITEQLHTRQARDALIYAESLREQVFSWVSHWAPQHKAKLSPVVDWFKQCRKQLGWCLVVGATAPSNEDNQATMQALLTQLHAVMQSFVTTPGGVAGELLDEQINQQLERLSTYELAAGAAQLALASTDELNAVLAELTSDTTPLFCQYPVVRHTPRETGSWARQQGSVTLTGLQGRICALYRELEQATTGFADIVGAANTAKVEPVMPKGCAIVETARGSLLHKVELNADNSVKSYQIIAPTEWNFHPEGSLKMMLEGAKLPWDEVTPMAEMLISLLDPCVPWQLELNHA
ncbi:nickel-dependent hydrogenase large subunit [Alteromonas lipolytica]|uniref:Ni,Fe-hydrogenase I large subunit n=1 Tax=Alteromonas lipolytica TaxID=1856405 RepID=A0A1E8FDW1_9ALTE|nr:nickel-dependent hydrogenase large subunit [Alteromonas lipolytica]OFI34137.1 hypothetical protein BFC17_21570 [Alteromonas lipolytica]GGF65112.1 hydrogenase expression/formation protein HupK [Alteromonas lipolytica]